jgi:hypothetical protein
MNEALLRLLDELVASVPKQDVDGGEEGVRRELAGLPVPLRPKDDAAPDRRRELQRVAAVLAARAGRTQELLGVLMRDFRDGASARPLVALLLATGEPAFAATIARLALTSSDCQDRDALEELLAAAGRPPDGWSEALVEFARSPSVEGWDELMRFTPPDVYYDRIRNALRLLRGHGVDPVLLFRLATRHGTTPDAMEVVEPGLVPPDVVASRGEGSPAASMGSALAAVAAQVRGDRFAIARHLREAWNAPDRHGMVESLTMEIRERADGELLRFLDAAGVPVPG